MNKNIKFLAAAVAVGVFSLSSCGGNKKSIINMWTGFGSSMTTQLENVLKTYQETNKDKLSKFEIKHTGQGGYDGLLAAIAGSVSTRTYPQIAVAYPDHMAQYNESKILFSLDNNIKEDKIDLTKYYPNYLAECQEIVEGSTLGLPFNKSTEVLTTNKTFIEALIGLTADAANPEDKITGVPTTWQELEKFGKAAIKVLTEKQCFNAVIAKSADGKYARFKDKVAAVEAGAIVVVDLAKVGKNDFRICSYDSQPNFFITAVRQWGGTYTVVKQEGKYRNGYMKFNSPEVKTMLKFFNGLFKQQIIGIPSDFNETSYTSTPFKNFKSIFTIGSSAGVSNCVPKDGLFNVEINALPYNADRPDCKYVISQGTNLVMFRNTDEESRKQTWELLKTLSYDAKTNAEFAKSTGYIPVTKDAYNEPSYQAYLNDESLVGTAKTMRDAIKVNFDKYLGAESQWIQFVDPGFVGSSAIRSSVGTIMAEVRDIKKDADVDAEIDRILKAQYDKLPTYVEK